MMGPYGETHGRAQQGRSAPDRDQVASEIARIEPVGRYALRPYFSDGHDTGIYSWDLLYDYGTRQDEMWRHYLKRMKEAGASREPPKGKA
jgi:DUF971 family protein